MIMVMMAVINYQNDDHNKDNYRILQSGMKIRILFSSGQFFFFFTQENHNVHVFKPLCYFLLYIDKLTVCTNNYAKTGNVVINTCIFTSGYGKYTIIGFLTSMITMMIIVTTLTILL